jgi:outer membrane protein OmpA-like peptidoglycan-associated protein
MITRLVLVVSLVIASSLSLEAQNEGSTARPDSVEVTPIRLGIAAGLSANTHSAGFVRLPGTPNCCPEFESGWGVGPYVSILGELPLSQTLLLGFRAGYQQHDARLSREEPIAIEGETGPVPTSIEHSIEGSLASVGAEVRAQLHLSRAFLLSLGARVGSMIRSDFSQIERLDESITVGTFENGRRTRNEFEGEIPGAARATAALLFGAGYDIPLSRSGYLRATPEITFGLALTSVNDSVVWMPHALQLGVAITYDFARYRRDTPEVLPEPRLAADVRIELPGDSSSPGTIRATEVVDIRHSPIIPAVYFDSAGVSIPTRYRSLNAQSADTYTTHGFEAFDFDAQHRDVLNVIGARMRQHPHATLTLVPSVSADEPRAVAEARVDAVRQYLSSVWGVEDSRMASDAAGDPMRKASEKFPDGKVENRHVGIRASQTEILAPVPSQRMRWRFHPERVSVVPSIVADAGVDRAELEIALAGRSLKRFAYGTAEWSGSAAFDWTIETRELDTASLPARMTARLEVIDSTGRRVAVTADSALAVVSSRTVNRGRFEVLGRRKRITYQLVALPLGSPELDPPNKVLMEELAAQVRPGATITIRGYSDRLGNPEYNRTLSQRRAEIAKNTLLSLLSPEIAATITIDAQGFGVDTSRFDNDLPEGRVLTRGASVVLEQDE